MSLAAALLYRLVLMLFVAGVGALIGSIVAALSLAFLDPNLVFEGGIAAVSAVGQFIAIAGAAIGALAGLVILHQQ
ncbi:hypothetical protein SAMN02745157_1433 [Kaistia soli DSM 19436]|uniref:Uncharacterized protein n=1 Tax=Kaistia soli DSM 19436 TaxID=1122133 RepID=A0A1M4Y5M4_9HYPH|nr:hypothetical protein [Kaistia soli]SHF01104.1 hypothetical protein SAMN02745157_1433 [Kaistia soli DSM 19436]